MNRTFCEECFKKQQRIDRLTEENQRLRSKLRYRERTQKEGFFGSSTPSSKVPVKPNAVEPKRNKKPGAKPGHKGSGRKRFDESEADEVIELEVEAGSVCPDCAVPLRDKGAKSRLVLESRPVKVRQTLYRLHQKYCPQCRRRFTAKAPSVLPRSLYGNQALASAAAMHYLHGVPMGRICEQMGIEPGSLVQMFHRLAHLFADVPEKLIEQYRTSAVKHADETGWRTNGKNGYVWLFATDKISLFQFRNTRSAKVPRAVFGQEPLPGRLVVDRYAAYNKSPCKIQYCYSHLSRDVEDIEKEFPDSAEVKTFVSAMVPMLSLAMNLRSQPISDKQFYRKAARLKKQILAAVAAPAQHGAIRNIQRIFQHNEARLYHWADDRRVPAENNLAERDLRPTVIARKVSFGSQSDAGAKTRGTLMSVMHTLRKHGFDPAAQLKHVLDQLAHNIAQDPYSLLFPRDAPVH